VTKPKKNIRKKIIVKKEAINYGSTHMMEFFFEIPVANLCSQWKKTVRIDISLYFFPIGNHHKKSLSCFKVMHNNFFVLFTARGSTSFVDLSTIVQHYACI
jgi:hypothetical protein